ncbi:MAG: hypothetical protein QOF29_563 [bacterium]
MTRRWTAVLVAAIAATLGGAAGAMAQELPLGPAGLPESRSTRALAPGLTATQIVRGGAPAAQFFTVDAGFTLDRAQADATAARVRAAGVDAAVVEVDVHAPDSPLPGPTGFFARAGRFATQAEAQATADRLTAASVPGVHVDHTSDDGTPTRGPWRVHVLEVDPRRYAGVVAPAIADGVLPGRETVSAIAGRVGASAAVNGGYFVIGEQDGTPGDLAGLSVIAGEVVSEAVDGRTDLVLPRRDGGGARVVALSSALRARASDGARREVDGRNRRPGLIRSCGGDGGDRPTERPLHDVTCTDPSELIQFTRWFGATADRGSEIEAVLDRDGRVTALRPPGGPIPSAGSVLGGTGDAATWLRAHARSGMRVRVGTSISAGRRPLRRDRALAIVNGGPRLLAAGRPAITAAAEGFTHPGDPEFFYRFGVRRNPRTLAGVTRAGRLLLVTVDGRAPGYSVGLSFAESAALMAALGARDAVNLDGGGSTTMTLGSTPVTRPSDTTGERPVGDAIVLDRRPRGRAAGGAGPPTS